MIKKIIVIIFVILLLISYVKTEEIEALRDENLTPDFIELDKEFKLMEEKFETSENIVPEKKSFFKSLKKEISQIDFHYLMGQAFIVLSLATIIFFILLKILNFFFQNPKKIKQKKD
jgi:uncharacterized membrane protein